MAYSRGKLTKHKVLSRSRELSSVLPATKRMSKRNLWSMANRYRSVIVKPSGGWGGQGVMQVSLLYDDEVEIHDGKKVKVYSSREKAYKFLREKMDRTPHIVQQKITLATVDGRPFDIRVMVQRNRGSSDWRVTGKLAKIAGAGYIITNTARSRGKVVTLPTAIRRSNVSGASVSRLEEEIDRIALRSVRQLRKHYSIRTVGLDMGLDNHGKPWIIEANFTPNVSLFARLKDRTMYRRILSYGR